MEIEADTRLTRSQKLAVFGVVQYRRRSLVVEPEDCTENRSASPITSRRSPIIESVPELDVRRLGRNIKTEIPNAAPAPSQQVEQPVEGLIESGSALAFELLSWQVPGWLVLEFSAAGKVDQVDLRHRLMNNILLHMLPSGFRGAAMHQHQWPVIGHQAKDSAAREWVLSMILGHRRQNPESRLWLMGELGVGLLFPVAESTEVSNSGARLLAPQGIEVLVTPDLKSMLGDPASKQKCWHTLKSYSQRLIE